MITIILFITVTLNALSSGFFFAWSVSVILGTKKVNDINYLESMQNINREILNPAFFIVFFGSIITLFLSAILQYNYHLMFWFISLSALIYLIGTFGITALGNVPLNNELEAINLAQLEEKELKQFRNHYEKKWNRYHMIRTISSIISFILLVLSIFIKTQF